MNEKLEYIFYWNERRMFDNLVTIFTFCGAHNSNISCAIWSVDNERVILCKLNNIVSFIKN